MKKLLMPVVAVMFLLCATLILSFTHSTKKNPVTRVAKNVNPKIQVAILLDVSGSMDGLIEQAKAQLWNMVTVLGKASCDGKSPQIEIALYEYGRSSNNVADGYVKQISGFTKDLDLLSKNLFSLTTNGGEEYCGQVIYTSLKDLKWDISPQNYKVIFIAGNEDFLQGNLLYTKACDEAKKKGVIVNTIYCGDRLQGIKEHWNLNTECGNGSFTVINQNEKIDDIPTPYDSLIIALNDKLNNTYIAYGYNGYRQKEMQTNVDNMNYASSKTAAVKRAAVKGNAKLYNNDSWDIVDASKADANFIEKVDRKTLPDSLQKKTTQEIKLIVNKKATERNFIQQKITDANKKRENYLTEQKASNANKNQIATLESEVEKIIKQQAKRFNMIIE